MGLAAYHRERLYDIERANAMAEAAALAFAGKVEIVADDSLLEFFPASFPAEVEVHTGGKTLRKRVIAAAGDPGRPLDDATLREKATKVLSFLPESSPQQTIVNIGLAGFDSDAACQELADALWYMGVER
jgi:2-methylcitrate dehydratase PrpD